MNELVQRNKPKKTGTSEISLGNNNTWSETTDKTLRNTKKRHTDTTIGSYKCTCTRHHDMVTAICPCLDDNYHMPTLHVPEPNANGHPKQSRRTSSLSKGWENYVQSNVSDENGIGTNISLSDDQEIPTEREHTKFCTGSSYLGQWNILGMKGSGIYIMPHGVAYSGELDDGQFHGKGTLTYPNGIQIHGVFEKGKMIKWDLEFDDGLQYNEPWNYCQMPDRRFYPEILKSMAPAGCSYITPHKPPRQIPKGCYDTGDGYFDPKTKCIYSAHQPFKMLRVASKLEEEWILASCRQEEDHTTQYRPDLYPKFVTGCDEYTLERNRSTETINSDELMKDTNDNYLIAELMNIPPIKSEIPRNQFGRNVIETSIRDTSLKSPGGSRTKQYGHLQFSAAGQSALVSKVRKSKSGTVELKVKQGVLDETCGLSTLIESSTIMKKNSIKTLACVETNMIIPEDRQKPMTIMGGMADLSIQRGVRAATTDIDEFNVAEMPYRKLDPNSLIYPHSLSLEDTSSDTKKLAAPSNKGSIEIEVTINSSDEHHHETDATLRMKKESHTQRNKETVEIQMDSHISSYSSRANTNIDISTDKCTSMLVVDAHNTEGEINVDVQSFSYVEKPRSKAHGKGLIFQTEFKDAIHVNRLGSIMEKYRSSSKLDKPSESDLTASVYDYLKSLTTKSSIYDVEDNKDESGELSEPSLQNTSSLDISTLESNTDDDSEDNDSL